ncbi:MAG: GntR family transcriptional regulator [Chitinivibrionales bacterium]|nr:GntR family transcriptional regulator [Chitinivibrionales bacterium]
MVKGMLVRVESPAVNKALRFLDDRVHRAAANHDPRLPPIRQLASEAGVSYVSMWKAVRALAERGRLVTNHRTGVRLPLPSQPPEQSPRPLSEERRSPRTKWERVCRRLQADILNGVYAPGAIFPAPKELSRQYGVCHATLRKALDRLVDERWLQVNRRGYRVPSSEAPRHHGAIALVARGSSDGRPSLPTNRSQDHLRALESECARNGVALRVVSCDPLGNILHVPADIAPAFAAQPVAGGVLGTLVWTVGMASAAGVTKLIRRCMRIGTPLAILDESGEWPLPPMSDPRVRGFTVAASAHAGRRVGTFLLRLGHREVAFVSPVHSMAWSRNRLEGLVSAFADAGFADGVRVLTAPGSFRPRPESVTERRMEQLLTRLPEPRPDDDAMFSRAIRFARETMEDAIRAEIAHGRLIGLLDRHRAARTATAWVVVCDGFALDCIDYLRERGIRVPEDISVVGFDDTHEAFRHGLTSYNFNGQALMHAMVGHVLARHESVRRRHRESVEIDGFINTRRTTAPARTSAARYG